MRDASQIEVSVVIPCLNEADTLEGCLERAKLGLQACGVTSEIIVADNSSVDGSAQIAEMNGAAVVSVEGSGYGSALMGGIAAARGRFIIIADADHSYDLTNIPRFVETLRGGADIAQGCRFPAGGGELKPGSMSLVRKKLGNPLFSLMVRKWFHVPIHDVNCGFRGFKRTVYDSLDMQCTGMEFAPEMIVKAGFLGARIEEIPITYHPDGRISHPSHNRAIRDGWRTLRFLLMYSPRWLFLIPGIAAVGLGIFIYAASIFGMLFQSRPIEIYVFATLLVLCGYQSILFAVFTKVFATQERLLAPDERFERLFDVINLERVLAVSFLTFLVGAVLFGVGVSGHGIRFLDPLGCTFLGASAIAMSFQTILSGFFLSILGLRRR